MDFHLPELGEGVYEAEMSRWLVQPGAAVKPGQALLEVLTDKATMEVPAPFAGTIDQLRAEPGQQIKVGQVMLTYSGGGAVSAAPAQESPGAPAPASPGPPAPRGLANGPASGAVKAAPSVRLLARKLGIDLARLRGSGPQGRILVEDLSGQVSREPEKKPATPAVDLGKAGTRIPLQGLRRKIAEHMVKAAQTIPHFTYVDECNVTDLVQLRASLREPLAQQGIRLTYLSFFVKAVAAALREVPIVNASLDERAGEIVLHDAYHVGIAVAAPQGLIVPVIRDADQKSLFELAREVDRLSTAARAGKTRLEDLKGGTFTITSIGNFGGLFATPIIHAPQVGILGIGKIAKRPIYNSQGNLQPADMVYLSLTFDHRVLDGGAATAFGNAILDHLRQPARMLLP